ncbi:LOW QUALITY PROTEIN: hypothetical protein RJ640_005782 [Escallonia rubra]|uniref:PGG domain-containing protein n=1 Tax=Escallonia rubra TaxID=112253 RepID=A0AA88UJ49_9ASTE|nr:LOW QUALITY PROTEIN: hypothetical protein RJ640_005782 [Escallonia rubra]
MASSGTSSVEKYPYPSHINVGEYVPYKLSQINYFMWSNFIARLVEDQGLMGFINGTITAPPKKITVPDDSSPTGTKEVENEDYIKWKKTDLLLRGWILGTLNEDVLVHVHFLKTAKEVWAGLERVLRSQDPPDLVGHVVDMGEGKNISQYLPLHKAALAGDWETASTMIEKEPDAVRAIITGFEETALIVAVRLKERNAFVKNLLEKMLLRDVALAEKTGSTALHIAALVGNIEAAEMLVGKDPKLPNVGDINKALPIHRAALYGRREMVLYLFTVTKEDSELKPFEGESGGTLLRALISSGLYDVALFLLQRYPKLACEDPSPLDSIAAKPSAFPSGTRFNPWQKLIYSLSKKVRALFWKVAEVRIWLISLNRELHIELAFAACSILKFHGIAVPQINHIKETKLKHTQAVQLVKRLCMETVNLEYSKASSLLELPLKTAIRVGIREIVEEILESFPSAVYLRNETQQTLMHLAILNRRENVYNLIYQFDCGDIFISPVDARMNNGLHLTGKLETQQKLNLRASAAGAALQMQRELQWFKEVKKFARPSDKERVNSEGKTPAMVFTEAHEKLVKDGEQWMKDTANSCTIVAALIVTVVFASAITVPGGNNGDTGLPIYIHQTAFVVFAISDALALFSSTSSLLMFLSILTSRYGEQDFLYALPKRLIIGLVTLFLSIISMMIAFTATIYMLFEYKGRWILIPVAVLSGLPVTIFMWLQFPLLLDLIKSTYKPGIFGKQSDRILF